MTRIYVFKAASHVDREWEGDIVGVAGYWGEWRELTAWKFALDLVRAGTTLFHVIGLVPRAKDDAGAVDHKQELAYCNCEGFKIMRVKLVRLGMDLM